jgi:hypothetical protein
LDDEGDPFLLDTEVNENTLLLESHQRMAQGDSFDYVSDSDVRAVWIKYLPTVTREGVYLRPPSPMNGPLSLSLEGTWADHPLQCVYLYFFPRLALLTQRYSFSELLRCHRLNLLKALTHDCILLPLELTIYQPTRLFDMTCIDDTAEAVQLDASSPLEEELGRASLGSMVSLTSRALHAGRCWILILQALVLPLFMMWTSVTEFHYSLSWIAYLLPVVVVLLCILVETERLAPFMSIIGTFQSVAWIALSSSNIVDVLRATAFTLDWNEVVIGLIVIANANSLGGT